MVFLQHEQRGCLGQRLVFAAQLLLELAHFLRVSRRLLLGPQRLQGGSLPLRQNRLRQAFPAQEWPKLFI